MWKTRRTGKKRREDEDSDEESCDDEDPDTAATFQKGNELWQLKANRHGTPKRQPAEADISEDNVQKAYKAATASQKKEFVANVDAEMHGERHATVDVGKSYKASDVWAWLDKTRNLKDEHGQPKFKEAQIEMLRRICARVVDELQEMNSDVQITDPLLWLLHGEPGTGKSEVLHMVKNLFQEVCGWQMGLEYQMAALQAVTAQLLGGDTLHHACGFNPFGNAPATDAAKAKAATRRAEVAARVQQWRWLFIDEISMVSAQLLAEIDAKLRTIMS